ncbi:helix-turn-helix transcriptional regulator [Halosegnis marinus]|uniref:Helix-turn-helix transcriptional regulator n=1 Tax=Halosegnis marinus TaxID=3034023 RepID=A0ABD5ZTD0_9EURY|nr:GntR family transcriptional regulator [Halosegnis sp. DT85]
MTDVADLLPVVARREPLVSALHGSPAAKCDLVDALDVSRSTVDRAVRRLEAEGVVERRDGGYGLTLAGRLVFEEYRTLERRAAGVFEARDALDALPADADIEPAALVGATTTVSDRTTPYRPGDRHLELVAEADSIDLLSTAVGPRYVEAVHDAVVEGGTRLRLGVAPGVAERLVAGHGDTVTDAVATGRAEIRELADPPAFSLATFDRGDDAVLGLLVYADGGPRAYVENDAPAAVAYGRDRFERHWAEAEPVATPAATDG